MFSSAAAGESLRRTPLYALHKELGAKTTEFGGWDMPLMYTGPDSGIMKEHLHCRAAAGLFDVSQDGSSIYHWT